MTARTSLLAILVLAALALTQPAAAKLAPVRDLKGVRHVLPDPVSRATVLLFIGYECPISNGYAPEINRICATYTPRHVRFYLVYVDPDVSTPKASQHAHDFGYRCPALLDPSQRLVKWTGAKITPEAVVLAPDGKMLYRGRIDNRYVDLGQPRFAATRHDLRDTLDAILLGKSAPQLETKVIGCTIPPAR